MHKLLFFLVLITQSYLSTGQNFEIYNKTLSKLLKPTEYVEIELKQPNDGKGLCCTYSQVNGKILSIFRDSVTVAVRTFIHGKDYNTDATPLNLMVKPVGDIMAFDKRFVSKMTVYSSEKSKRNINRYGALIGALIVVGGSTILTGIIFGDDAKERWKYTAIGGIQIGTGITLGIISPKEKKFNFRGTADNWAFK
jgi:hypothetical protein